MKLLGRILIILTVAMLVVGATLAIAGNGSSAQASTGSVGGRSFSGEGDHNAQAGSGLAGLLGIMKNLIVISIVTVIVVLPQRLRTRRNLARSMAGR